MDVSAPSISSVLGLKKVYCLLVTCDGAADLGEGDWFCKYCKPGTPKPAKASAAKPTRQVVAAYGMMTSQTPRKYKPGMRKESDEESSSSSSSSSEEEGKQTREEPPVDTVRIRAGQLAD